MTTLAVERAPSAPIALGGLAVAGVASMGAGAVHAAAIGAHAEHRQAVLVFAALAVVQLGWGALALTRSSRLLAVAGAVVNAAAVVGFALAKTRGISFVEGLDEAEPVQLADGAAALLAAISVAVAFVRPPRSAVPWTTLAVAALSVPAMVSAGAHTHAHGDGHGLDESVEAGAGHTQAGAPAVVPPKAYDPTKPIDLSGVAGVTPEQQARAENLISITLARLPRFADPAVAEAEGYRTIGDGFTGHEHYVNWAALDDGRLLDPDHPESLVYQTFPDGRPKQLVAAMFMMGSTDTLDDVPDVGGALTQWHVHEDLCFTDTPGDHKVRGVTRPDGSCPAPLVKPAQGPMIHVWIVPHACGPFASLEGIAGGQIKAGEARLCDHAHGSA